MCLGACPSIFFKRLELWQCFEGNFLFVKSYSVQMTILGKRSRVDDVPITAPCETSDDHAEVGLPDLVSVYHAPPTLQPPESLDASVDPTTQPIEIWKGNCALRLSSKLAGQSEWNVHVQVAYPRLYLNFQKSATSTEGNDFAVGIALDYRSILMHALQNEEENQDAGIYMQIALHLTSVVEPQMLACLQSTQAGEMKPVNGTAQSNSTENNAESEEDEENEDFSEIWLFPQDKSQCTLLKSRSLCKV
jgi:hypothetical protein